MSERPARPSLVPDATTAPSSGCTVRHIFVPIVIAEISFPLWLLTKGFNAARWEKKALASA